MPGSSARGEGGRREGGRKEGRRSEEGRREGGAAGAALGYGAVDGAVWFPERAGWGEEIGLAGDLAGVRPFGGGIERIEELRRRWSRGGWSGEVTLPTQPSTHPPTPDRPASGVPNG